MHFTMCTEMGGGWRPPGCAHAGVLGVGGQAAGQPRPKGKGFGSAYLPHTYESLMQEAGRPMGPSVMLGIEGQGERVVWPTAQA